MDWQRGRSDLCPFAVQIPAFLQGELTPRQWRRVNDHIELCGDCQSERIEFAMLLHRLEEMDSEVALIARRPLVSLARLRRPRTRFEAGMGLVTAVLLLLVLARGPDGTRETGANGHQIPAGLSSQTETLLGIQNEDGSWSPRVSLSFSAPDAVTTTALCVHALGKRNPDDRAHQLSIDSGARFLLRSQRVDGRIGSTLESHMVALWALKQLRASSGWMGMNSAIESAENYLAGTQCSSFDVRRREVAQQLTDPAAPLPEHQLVLASLVTRSEHTPPRDPLRLATLCLSF